MKRIFAILLAAVLLLPILPTASAEDLTAQQEAVVQTAIAFYLKDPYMQYDSCRVSRSQKGGKRISRGYETSVPEDATADRTVYSVCSSFSYLVYRNALDYELCGSYDNCVTVRMFALSGDIAPVKYVAGSGVTLKEATDRLRAAAQPADVFVFRRKDGTGHAMVYVGDIDGDGMGDLIHCTGDSFDMENGKEHFEKNGSIKKTDAFKSIMTEKGLSQIDLEGFVLLRPLAADAKDCAPTAAAAQRIKYPWFACERTVSCGYYGSPATGDELTYSIKLTNKSTSAYTVPVTETVPDGTALKRADGAGVSGTKLSWSVPLAAGESKTVSYTVTVTAPRGTVITSGGGMAAGIESNVLKNRVGGKAVDAAKLQNKDAWADAVAADAPEGLTFAESVYRHALGIDLHLPSVEALTKPSVVDKGKYAYERITPVPTAEGDYNAMFVDGLLGGQLVTEEASDRVLELRSSYLKAGDIFVSGGNMMEKNPTVYISTGEELLTFRGGKITAVGENELIRQMRCNVFFCLRPSLAYDDVSALRHEAKPSVFSDVKESDWFYPYVLELTEKGVVSGMTATSFAPNGTLTYGQALKLIAKAVGEADQPAGSHWASGYLALANTKGWLKGDVDLDAHITRLALCKIAAKAKGLIIQAQNPFKDTNDPDVLALVNAGIINGMTATTFAPDGLLTRAQISKIIALMMKV